MADIGILNFSVGVNGEDLLAKALEKDKQEALEVQKILRSLNIPGLNTGGTDAAISKSQQAADKAALSSVKLREAREKAASSSLLGEQKLQTELEKTAYVQKKSANESSVAQAKIATEAQKSAAIQSAAASKQKSSELSIAAMLKEKEAKQALLSQRIIRGLRQEEEAQRRLISVSSNGQVSFNNAAGLTNKTLFSQKNLLNQISNAAGIYFSIYQVGAFVKNLALVSGEFEMQRISLENILQDVDAANKLFGQIKTLSVVSPFEFKDLVGYAKQLSAFSIPVNELYDTTKRLADVSAGLGVDMGRIILAYGQVRSASVLRGQELRQFTEAGIPLVDELAKKFGELEGRVVSSGEVFDKISNRLVPFAMVKDVFNDLTSEGGKFFEMQERQSESLKGKIANLKDAYDIMLYSIGTANDGILKGGIEGITSLMKNWEAFADALMAAVVAYGVYRTAVILNTAITKGFTEAIRLSTVAMKIHDAVLKSTPWGLALSAITALIGGIVYYTSSIRKSNEELMESIGAINKQSDSCNELVERMKYLVDAEKRGIDASTEMKKITDELNDSEENGVKVSAERKKEIEKLSIAEKEGSGASAERASIVAKLNNLEPELAKNIKNHATNLGELTKIQEKYNALMDARKFGEYIINESEGTFEDGIIEDIEDMNDAQNETNLSAIKLENTYTSIREKLKGIKDSEGFFSVNGKQFRIPQEVFSDIEKITKSSDNYAEKARKINAYLREQNYLNAGNGIYNSLARHLDDGTRSLIDYNVNLRDLNSAQKEANTEIDDFADKMKSDLKLNTKIDFSNITKEEQDYLRNFVKQYEKIGKYGQKRVLLRWGIEFESNTGDDPSDTLDGWRKEIKDIVGNSILITTDSNIEDTIKAIQEKIADNKKRMENLEPTLVKFGYDFGNMEFPKDSQVNDPTTPIWKKEPVLAAAESYNTLYNSQKDCEKAAKGLNIELQKTGNGGSNKDMVAEKSQKQIDLIKKAQALYEKYTSVMNKEDAVKKVQSDGRFSKDFNPEDYKKYLQEIYDQLGNSPEQKKIKEALSDLFSDIDFGKTKKGVDEIMKKVGDEIDRFKDSYDFYEKLLGAGEDKQNAIKIAFGVEFKGNEVDLGKKLSEIVKDASKKVGLEVDFDINKGSIIDQLGDVYNTLTPELKKQIDALEKYRKDKQENTYLEYLSFIQKEVPEGTGVAFDLSSVLVKMKNDVNDIQNKAAKMFEDDNPIIDKSNINKAKELQIKSANDVAANNAKNIGSNFVEQSFKNKMLWDSFNNMSDASYGDIKKMIEEIAKLQQETLSKKGISQIFSTNKLTGKDAKKEDNTAFTPIMQMLGNSSDVDALNETVVSLLQNINDHKAGNVELDERLNGLTGEQLNLLRIVLSTIKGISTSIKSTEYKWNQEKLKRDVEGFKKLSSAATNVVDNVEGLAEAFGVEFDDITKGSLDLVKTIASSTMDVVSTITSFVDDSGKAMSLSALMADKEITALEKASVIIAIISAALQIAMKIASIFTGNKTKRADDAIKSQQQQLDDLQRSYDQTEKSAEKFYTLEADSTSISKWLSSEKAAIKARYGYLKLFGKMGQEAMNSMYKNAEEEAKSMEGMSVIQIQQKNLEQQKRALESQIKAAEGDNKKGKRNDEIDGYRNQLKDLDDQLTETRDKWYETLRGFSMQDVANDFAEAWVEAFEKGEDSIDALDKKFNELIKNMIIKQAAMRVVSSGMKDLLKIIDDAIGEDGVLTENEIGGIMGALPDTLKKINDEMNGIIKPLLDKMGITFGSASEAGEGLSKDIAGVTEDTASLLASYLNAMRADLANQKIYFQKIIDAIIPMSNNFALQVAELKKIEANTYRTANNTEENVKILNRIEGVLNSITRQGSGKKVNI